MLWTGTLHSSITTAPTIFSSQSRLTPSVQKYEDGNETKTVGLRQYGASKEHRPNPLVQIDMFIDKTGFPLAICINPGDINEQVTLIPIEKKKVEDMDVKKIEVCTDGGLSGEENRFYNSTAERSFITVQSLRKLSEAYIICLDLVNGIGAVFI